MSGIRSIEKLKSVLEDKYEIVGLIASGGMGEIYLGIHRVLGKKRAIKVIHQEVEKEKDIRKRFIQEARLAASIDHPGIIQIMDFGSHDEFDYLIMPYIDGVTLQDKMNDGIMRWEESIDLMIPMVEAISHAHRKNIIHRDIKPANYMIDKNGRVILTDFGISKNLKDATLTAANTILGSPKFMSPEQITGKKVDKRSDLYSLGLVFYQMMTGINPFDADEITSVMYKQVHEVPQHPSTLNQDIPQEVGDVLARLLEKNPDDRYPDADGLLKDLQRLKNLQFSDAGGKTILQRPSFLRRRPDRVPAKEEIPVGQAEETDSLSHDAATRIISPGQRAEVEAAKEKRKKSVAGEVPGKKKNRKPVFLIIAGILFLVLIAAGLMVATDILHFGNKQAKLVTEPMQPEETGGQTKPPSEVPSPPELPATVADIRVDPKTITETLGKDKFVVKTIHVSNVGDATLSNVKIVAESDGPNNFLGPVNKASFEVDAGGSTSFSCPINSANIMPGSVRTGRIKIFSNDPDENPAIIDVRLTVKEGETNQAATGTSTSVHTIDKADLMAKPDTAMATLRPQKVRENNFLKTYESFKGRRLNADDIRKLLQLSIGLRVDGGIDRQTAASIKRFLTGLSYLRYSENTPCDILISCEPDGTGMKLTVQNNFYDCGTICSTIGFRHQNNPSLDELSGLLQRFHCYQAMTGLSMVNSIYNGARIDLELPMREGNSLFIDDEVRLCMTPAMDAACMILDINLSGVNKLFPIIETQQAIQEKAKTQCSINIGVAPPAGFEMVVALGTIDGRLISDFRNRFEPEAPIILWPFSGEHENSAITFCDELFLRLINEPVDKWCINSRIIRIRHKG